MLNAPAGRSSHTAVWTDNQMIVWGGYGGFSTYFNAGSRYNPNSDSWAATNIVNAPAPRESHAAVWTGSEMIVWGGRDINGAFNTGGRYCALTGPPPSPTPTATASPSPTTTA